MLRVGEQHSDKHNVDRDEESMETIAPMTKSPIAPSWGVILIIVVERRCGKRRISLLMTGSSRTRCSLSLERSGSHTVVDGISSFNDNCDVDQRSSLP